MSIGVLPCHKEGHRFDADFFALLNVHRLRFEPAAFDPPLVHPKQHVGPIARFSAARAGMNRHECVRAIVFAGQKLPQLEFVQLVSQALMFSDDFFLCLRAMCRIVFFRSQFLQRPEILDLALQLLRRALFA